MAWPLLTVADLSPAEVERCFHLADELRTGAVEHPTMRGTVALLFYETSLRTRAAFTVAANRLGLGTLDIYEPRHSAISMPESWPDTLRTIGDIVDVVVARVDQPLVRKETIAACACPLINAGDRGPDAEHPTQALIDLYAIRTLTGDGGRAITVVGDPRMRAVRSLVRLADAVTDHELTVVTDDDFLDERTQWFLDSHRVRAATVDDLGDLNPEVLYVAGMPHDSLPLDRRARLIVDNEMIRLVPSSAIILSPMPVIDEIEPNVKATDGRVRIFEQNELGASVRTALLMTALDP